MLHLCALSCHIAYYKTVHEPCIKLRLQIKLYHKFSTIFTIVKQWFHAFLLRPHSIKECRVLWLCESVSEFMKLFYYSFYSFMQCVWLEHSLCFHRFVVAEFIKFEPIVVLFDGENCSLLTPFIVFSLKRIWHWYDVILKGIYTIGPDLALLLDIMVLHFLQWDKMWTNVMMVTKYSFSICYVMSPPIEQNSRGANQGFSNGLLLC